LIWTREACRDEQDCDLLCDAVGRLRRGAVFQLKHLMRVPETLYAEVAEVIGRGLGLFAIGWGIAGIAYLASGKDRSAPPRKVDTSAAVSCDPSDPEMA
jgi:hypothetical protein